MDYSNLKFAEIYQLAKAAGIKNIKKHLKSQLVAMLEALDVDDEVQDTDVFETEAVLEFTPNPESKGTIVVSVLGGCPVHMPTWQSVQTLAKHHEYDIVVLPVKWGTTSVDPSKLPQTVLHYYREDCNVVVHGTKILGNLNINANAAQPLSQLAGFAGKHNVVIPDPVEYLLTTTSIDHTTVKIIATTGTISDVSNVSVNSRAASITKFHAHLGCTIINTTNYPVVHYPYDKKLKGIPVGDKLYQESQVTVVPDYSFIYLPDMHLANPNNVYLKSLLEDLETHPTVRAIGGDLFDGSSLNHHEKNRLGYSQNKISLMEELSLLHLFAYRISNYTREGLSMIVGNHETFADRFWQGNLLQELQSFSTEDAALILRGMAHCLEMTTRDDAGIHYQGLIKYLVEASNIDVTFAPSHLMVNETSLGFHGNEWKTNKSGLRSANIKMVNGHGHAPFVDRNLTRVGYGGHPKPTYQSGLTNSAPAHCYITESGKRILKVYQYR